MFTQIVVLYLCKTVEVCVYIFVYKCLPLGIMLASTRRRNWVSESENESSRLAGKAALVTGARSAEELESAREEVAKADARTLVLPADLAGEGDAAWAVGQTAEAFGRIDVLINAAGTDAPGTVEELSVEGWDRTLSVNLRAPFLLSKAAFPRMREAGGGTIVNISSVAGKKGWANASAYCASKFGLTGLTEALADEGREHGIRAIVLYPGAMATNWGAFAPEE